MWLKQCLSNAALTICLDACLFICDLLNKESLQTVIKSNWNYNWKKILVEKFVKTQLTVSVINL